MKPSVGMGELGCIRLIPTTQREKHFHGTNRQSVQSTTSRSPVQRIRPTGEHASGRAPRERGHLLGTIHRHAVLLPGSCRFAPRDLKRPRLRRGEAGASGHHPEAEHVQSVLRQRASPRCNLRGPVLDDDGSIPGPETARRALTQVPFQEHTASLDSTTITLRLSLFPSATFRRAKGGVKAHVLLDHDDYLPAYVLISQATMHDAKVLGLVRLNAGSIVTMDPAYNDYRQFARWTDAGVSLSAGNLTS